jgi:P-type conjugative transfer protein TrbJ
VEQLNLFPQAVVAPARPLAGVPDPAWPLAARTREHPAEEQGGGARRALWGRRAVTLVGVVGLMTALVPNRASALFGIPGIPQLVYDPAAVTNLATTITRLGTQITLMRNQYDAFVTNTRKLTSGYAWRDITSTVNNVNTVVSGGQALSYSTAGLAAQLGTTFPGYSYNPLTAPTDMRTQKERALSTVMQQLIANQGTGAQLATSVARLAAIKGQVRSLSTAQQAAEVNATIGVLGAEETALLRQQLLAQGSAQAVVAVEALNQRLQATAAVAAFEAPAAAIAATPPTRPRMDASAWTY